MLWKDLDVTVQVVLRHANVPLEEVNFAPASDAPQQLIERFDPTITVSI